MRKYFKFGKCVNISNANERREGEIIPADVGTYIGIL